MEINSDIKIYCTFHAFLCIIYWTFQQATQVSICEEVDGWGDNKKLELVVEEMQKEIGMVVIFNDIQFLTSKQGLYNWSISFQARYYPKGSFLKFLFPPLSTQVIIQFGIFSAPRSMLQGNTQVHAQNLAKAWKGDGIRLSK